MLDAGYWILDKGSFLCAGRGSGGIRRAMPIIPLRRITGLLKASFFPHHVSSSIQYPVSSIQYRRLSAAGFTLLEILVAVFILGVVVTTVLASFNMVFSTTGALEASAAMFESGKTSLNRIVYDLENLFVLDRPIYKLPAANDPPDPYRFQGGIDSFGGMQLAKLRFTSRAHVPLSPSRRDGIAEIVYYLQPDGAGSLRLKRADHLYPYPRFEERGSDPVLCENVKSLAFEYVDAEGSVGEDWDSESAKFGNATPGVVAVRLEVANGSDSYVFQTTVALPMVRRKAG
jgi:general secretion pathway protein J